MSPGLQLGRTRLGKQSLFALAALLICAGLAWSLTHGSRRAAIPTTHPQRGDLAIKAYTQGELRPTRSVLLTAPVVGGALQIEAIKPTGTVVKKDEVVIEFDPSEQQYALEQARSEAAEVEAEITRSQLDAQIQDGQDQVSLLSARFNLRRAELEVSRNELVSAIEAKKNDLSLDEAKRSLAQLEQDVPSRRASNRAGLVVLRERLQKARLRVQQAERALADIDVRSPVDGIVTLRENRDSGGGFFYSGMTLPEYREGDLVYPGNAIAEVIQLDKMQIQAKIDESDRTNVQPGQPVDFTLDALPGQPLRGKVASVAGQTSRGFGPGAGTRRFDVTILLERGNPALRPGMTGVALISGTQLKNVLLLPRQAVFEREGRPVVYIRRGGTFEPQPVVVKNRTYSQVVVQGLDPNSEVALVNPDERRGQRSGPPSSAPPQAPGRP